MFAQGNSQAYIMFEYNQYGRDCVYMYKTIILYYMNSVVCISVGKSGLVYYSPITYTPYNYNSTPFYACYITIL